jgi:dienelactone hydrolase
MTMMDRAPNLRSKSLVMLRWRPQRGAMRAERARATLARAGGLALVLAIAACAELKAPVAATSASGAPQALHIPFQVFKPDGDGPFPAVVLLHDCSGLGPRGGASPRRWAKQLVEWGYVVALPDSFSTRGFPDGVCTAASPDRNAVGPMFRVRNVYDTLRHVRTLSYVDGARVGVMGGSHGGAATLATLNEGIGDTPVMAQAKKEGFRAGVALYPGCSIGRPRFDTRYKAVAPLLILAGELDDWTPAEPCRRLAEGAAKEGAPVRIKVYPGAHHSFDSNAPKRFVAARNNANAPGGRGATTAGNAEAWADSLREVRAFLDMHLKR